LLLVEYTFCAQAKLWKGINSGTLSEIDEGENLPRFFCVACFFVCRVFLTAFRFVLGFDVFVSYARADCSEYAESLVTRLPPGISVRIDMQGAKPGKLPSLTLLLAVALSRVLVVLNSPRAAQSIPVRNEVNAFRKLNGGTVLPVEVGSPIEEAMWWREVENVARFKETSAAIAAKTPSSAVFDRIQTIVGFWKVRRRQAFVTGLFILGLGTLSIATYRAGNALDSTRKELGQAGKNLDAAQKAAVEQKKKTTQALKKNEELGRLNDEATRKLDTAKVEAEKLFAANQDLTRQNAAKAANIRAMDSRTNLERGEAIAALNDATSALALSIDSGALTRDVRQALARALQSAAAVQVYSAEETVRDLAATPTGVLVLLPSGDIERGRLGCSSVAARGGIVDDFKALRVPSAVRDGLRDALRDSGRASAVNFSFGELLLGFPNGSATRIRFQSEGNGASTPVVANWQPHRQAVRYLAETSNGLLTISVVPESGVSEYAISQLSSSPGSNVAHSWDITPLSPVTAFDVASSNGDVFGLIQQNGLVRLFPTDPRRVAAPGSRTAISSTVLASPNFDFKPHVIAFNPASPLVAVAGNASEIYVYRYAEPFPASKNSGEMLNHIEHMENTFSVGPVGVFGESKLMSWSPSGNRIAIAEESRIFVLDRQKPETVLAFTTHAPPIRKMRWVSESRLLSLDADTTVTMWDLERAAALSLALVQLRSLPLDDSNGPWKLARGSQRTDAVADLVATLRRLLETTIRPLPLCGSTKLPDAP